MHKTISSEYSDLEKIQHELFNIAKNGENSIYNTNIRKSLESLASKGYLMQSKNLTIGIMKAYTQIPDLIMELKKLLTDTEVIDFEAWRNTTKADELELECPNCQSHKIVLNITNTSFSSEQSTENLENNTSEPVNSYNYSNYICVLCDARFFK